MMTWRRPAHLEMRVEISVATTVRADKEAKTA